MRKLFFPLILICINAAISCKKEMVTDDKALSAVSNSVSNNAVAINSVNFGVLVSDGSADDKITVANKLAAGYVRTAIILKDFRGKDLMTDKYLNSGLKVLLNLNYDHVANRNGTKSPNPFPKDMVTYRKLLGAVLDKYKPEVAVIENEPTTDLYHSGPIEDYIAMLRVAIEVCHSKGVMVADGGIHVENIQLVMGGKRLSGNALEVQKLIAAYKTLDLDYVNVHTHGEGDSYTAGLLEKVADYLRVTTGKPVLSNEFSVHSTSTSLVTSMVNGFKAGKYKYAIVRSGTSTSGAKALNKGTSLLPNGVTYRDDIK
jgi:hypothetical protein